MTADVERQIIGKTETPQLTRKASIIAIFGKGGVGKTVLSAITTKILIERKNNRKILVIDADPAMGVSTALGAKPHVTIGQIRDEVIRTARTVRKGGKERGKITDKADYMLLEALVELERFNLLAMGRSEEVGCFCPVNDLLRDAIEAMVDNFDIIIIDGEAGVEQINRLVIRKMHTAIVVTDMSLRGINTAVLINDILHNLPIKCDRLLNVVNRVKGGSKAVDEITRGGILDISAYIPEEDNITRLDLEGRPLLDLPANSPAVLAMQQILANLLG